MIHVPEQRITFLYLKLSKLPPWIARDNPWNFPKILKLMVDTEISHAILRNNKTNASRKSSNWICWSSELREVKGSINIYGEHPFQAGFRKLTQSVSNRSWLEPPLSGSRIVIKARYSAACLWSTVRAEVVCGDTNSKLRWYRAAAPLVID